MRRYFFKEINVCFPSCSSAPCILDIHEEEQGEAVAFGPSGDVFYTISEGEGEPIWKYNFIP